MDELRVTLKLGFVSHSNSKEINYSYMIDKSSRSYHDWNNLTIDI